MVKPQKTHTHKSYRSHKSHKARLENKKNQKQSPPKKPSLQNNRLGLLYLATIHKIGREKWGVCPWVVSIAKPQTLPVSCCSRSCQNGCRNPPDAWHYRVLLHWLQYASWCLCLFRSHMSHELSWNLMNSLPSLFPVSRLRKRDFKLWFSRPINHPGPAVSDPWPRHCNFHRFSALWASSSLHILRKDRSQRDSWRSSHLVSQKLNG